MKRLFPSIWFVLAVAAGCSGATTNGFSDAGADGAAASIVPSVDGGKRKDAKTPDDDDDPPIVDGGKKDGTATKPDANVKPPPPATCSPGSVTGFTPTWKPPAKKPGTCTQTQIDSIIECLLDENADQTACKTTLAAAANQACQSCIVTNTPSATQYGALVVGDALVSINYAGCIALKTNDLTANGCGAKYQALGQCTTEACEFNCPVTDDISFNEYQQCAMDAESGGCATYATAAACADPLVQSGAVAQECDLAGGGTFIANAAKYAALFCK